MGKQPKVVTADGMPRTLQFLPGHKEVTAYTRYPEFCEKLISEASLIICCDFNTLSRIDKLEPLVQSSTAPKIMIDHHRDPSDFCDLVFSYPEMSSTCELAFRLIAAAGLLDYMDKNVATSITTGIVTDTRNFSVNCSNPEIYDIIYHLLQYGVDKQRIYRETMDTKSLDSMRLQAYAIYEKMMIYAEHKAALIALTSEDLEKFHYEKGDTEGLVNQPLQIPGIVYSIFLREDPDCIKVSCRSKDDFPVSKICEDHFDGGGHLQAAGGEYHGPIDKCIELIEQFLPDYDSLLPNKK